MATRTARYLIEDAFHRIAVLSEDEAPTAEQFVRGLTVLNDMMNGFEAEGIQYDHTDLIDTDTVNVPDFLLRSVGWMLCDELADEYGKTLTDNQKLQVHRSRTALQSYYYKVPVGQTDEGILDRRRITGLNLRNI
ncbi:MAG TPA: hypothetical protein VF501_06680 [Thiobacillus sp.]